MGFQTQTGDTVYCRLPCVVNVHSDKGLNYTMWILMYSHLRYGSGNVLCFFLMLVYYSLCYSYIVVRCSV